MLLEQTSAGRAPRWDWRLEANLNRKANGLALEGPSVGLYVPLLEFNQFVGAGMPIWQRKPICGALRASASFRRGPFIRQARRDRMRPSLLRVPGIVF